MRVPRRDNNLNDAIDLLDEKLLQFPTKTGFDLQQAWNSLDQSELDWVDKQIELCQFSRRYYLENYHLIRDEHGHVQTMYPFLDQQEIIFEAMEKGWAQDGCFRGIVLKPRQTGGTTFVGGIVFHRTIFEPRVFSVIMAQDEETTAELWRRSTYAYDNLPWWMQPERGSVQQERHMMFTRTDERQRQTDPGLDSTLLVSNAQRKSGVLIGRTVRTLHASEVSRWPDADVWTGDIEPSMNARDLLAIMESTAFGRSGLFYNMWMAAERGQSEWTPIFIPVYKVRKYSIPLKAGEKFTLTDDERTIRLKVKELDNFTIPSSFFKWRRRKIQATINATGSDETHAESYPITPGEAFVSSGLCAFPRKCLNEQESQNCRPPILIGEIQFTSCDTQPTFSSSLGPKLRPPEEHDLLDKAEFLDRLWVWELPDESDAVEYYIGADCSSGDGGDFSAACVWRIGALGEPDVQVASWHGLIDPSHYARVLAALGVWYHMAEIAVEYTGYGITTGNDLRWLLDYPNLYRWKHLDKVTNALTLYFHWMTSSKTRPEMINRMNQALIDKTVIIRDKHLIEEMRDFGRYEDQIKVAGIDNNDDMVMSAGIGLTALRERLALGGQLSEGSSGRTEDNRPKVPSVYAIYDQYMRQIEQVPSEEEGKNLIQKMEDRYKVKLPWRIIAVQAMKANTCWSPIHSPDAAGAERELYANYGMKDRHILPDAVMAMRDLLNLNHHEGGGAISEED
jgi:hypothetical protein